MKSSAPAVFPTSTSAKTSGLNWAVERLAEKVEGGSGSFAAKYASNGWDYTAVAYNPTTEDLYAISEKNDKHEAGQLLRISPRNGGVQALGSLNLKEQNHPDRPIRSAAFTSEGTLVLFNGDQIYTLNLKDEKRAVLPEDIRTLEPTALTGKLIGYGCLLYTSDAADE